LIVSDAEFRIKRKVEQQGISLNEWEINIYRGILTGYNDAFIINGTKRAELIAADPTSADIIKPMLRGKDIKRYQVHYQDLWLINSHNGLKEQNLAPIDVPHDFTAIYTHLQTFQAHCKKRADQGGHWTNLRNCAYLREFDREKIVYGESSKEFQCVVDTDGLYLNKTLFFIVGESLRFLAAFLNSRLFTFCFKDDFPDLQGDSRSFMKKTLMETPIKKPSAPLEQEISQLVNQVQAAKKDNQDTTTLERQIDLLFYKFYNLTHEEILIADSEFKLNASEYEHYSLPT